jgi:hypothetical protein
MNKRGVALILTYMVIAALTILAVAFFNTTTNENTLAKRQVNSTRAFWIAEAGLARAYRDWSTNVTLPTGAVSYGGGGYTITLAGTDVTVTGTYGGTQRVVQAVFTRIPTVFENTLSAGGDVSLAGLLARVNVQDKTRITGTYSQSRGAVGTFADKQEGVNQNNTTIKIPDCNSNGTQDEFADFVEFGRQTVQSYPADQVLYVQNNGTVIVVPSGALANKKVIYVEGSTPGQGNVSIVFDGNWQENEDMTIISTGTITYLEPLQVQENARLSTISWEDYNEASIFRSQHESVIYAHDDANFIDVLDWGSTTGNIIANDDVSLFEVLTNETFLYSERAQNGDLPPGFQRLSGTTGTPKLTDWQE